MNRESINNILEGVAKKYGTEKVDTILDMQTSHQAFVSMDFYKVIGDFSGAAMVILSHHSHPGKTVLMPLSKLKELLGGNRKSDYPVISAPDVIEGEVIDETEGKLDGVDNILQSHGVNDSDAFVGQKCDTAPIDEGFLKARADVMGEVEKGKFLFTQI